MNKNLDDMSFKELKDLQSQVGRAIASFEDRKKNSAIAELDARARALGYSLSELTGGAAKRKRSPASPKYANPADRAATWSGRGRKPRWFAAALAAGKQPRDMAI